VLMKELVAHKILNPRVDHKTTLQNNVKELRQTIPLKEFCKFMTTILVINDICNSYNV
jgi:hypothetical protein